MNLITHYLTNNPCYAADRSIAVKGLMLHSIGCPQPNPMVLIKNWDKASYKTACVHGFIGDNDVYITLPCMETAGKAMRGWHGGGQSNNTHIGVEMCEPSCIKYTGGANFTCSDKAAAVAFVKNTTRNAVELFAKLCTLHGLNPLTDIISHAEGHALGIASNHGDPDHLWRQLGMNYSMDIFRLDVLTEMQKEDNEVTYEQWKAFWDQMRAELRDNDSSGYSEEARTWSVNTGLIAGGSSTEFNGMWEDFLTREQLVTVLFRFAQMMDKA